MKLTNIFKHNFFRTELTIKVNVKKERLFDSSTGIFKFRIRKKLKSSMRLICSCEWTNEILVDTDSLALILNLKMTVGRSKCRSF